MKMLALLLEAREAHQVVMLYKNDKSKSGRMQYVRAASRRNRSIHLARQLKRETI